MSATNNKSVRLNVDALETRDMMSVSSVYLSGSTLCVLGDNQATQVEVRQSGSNYVVTDQGNGRTWSFGTGQVSRVNFYGGAANDRFINNVANLATSAWGYGGNDYLEGYNACDSFYGGAGDDTLVGYGGDDTLYGDAGNDKIKGMAGRDRMYGGDNNDWLEGGADSDYLYGQNGDDVLISIDNASGETVDLGTGRDTAWVDRNSDWFSSSYDYVYGAGADDKAHYINGFSNSGADRTLDGDRIADPTLKAGAMYQAFTNNPLFGTSGPALADIDQNSLGDCWLMAGLGAIANDNPHAIRQNVVDFGDGTYGVALGGRFYRVDNDLPVAYSGAANTTYAGLGQQGSMWAAIVEKAFAHYRNGSSTYASLEGGWAVEVTSAFGSTTYGQRNIGSYSSITELANDIANRFNSYQCVTIGYTDGRFGDNLPNGLPDYHAYVVTGIGYDAYGNVSSITLRNPWSPTNFVTLLPAQLWYSGRVEWGQV